MSHFGTGAIRVRWVSCYECGFTDRIAGTDDDLAARFDSREVGPSLAGTSPALTERRYLCPECDAELAIESDAHHAARAKAVQAATSGETSVSTKSFDLSRYSHD